MSNFVQPMSNPFGAAGGAYVRKWPSLAEYGPFWGLWGLPVPFFGVMRAKTYADTVPPFYLDNKWILGGCSSSEWGSLLRWEAFCLFDTLQKPVKKIPPSTFSIIWSEYGQKWYTLPSHVFISITYGHRTIAHAHFMHQALLPVSHSFFSLYICSPGNCESVLGSEVTDSVQQ